MRFVFFSHSIISDWNHGNAHFLRGVATELLARRHDVVLCEPADGWSRQNLLAQHGPEAEKEFFRSFPHLRPRFYDPQRVDLARLVDGADAVLVHEWSDPALVHELGALRRQGGDFCLLFHDTHHRSVTAPEQMAKYDLSEYDGVLAFGRAIRDVYLANGWTRRAWVWHEAADARRFRPIPADRRQGHLVWIGNWGDNERTEELEEYLLRPAAALKLKARVHGVRYPAEGRRALARCGIEYRGWLPNHRVPEIFGRYALTVHVPRRPYREQLHGIPTIRVFEALACGIPLISAPWNDVEGLFHPNRDFLVAENGEEMRAHMRRVLTDRDLASGLAARGRQTVLARHTCAHRVEELLGILRDLGVEPKTGEIVHFPLRRATSRADVA